MPRSDATINAEFDNPQAVAPQTPPFASVDRDVRDKLQLEVLLDIRKYLKTISEKE